MVEGGQAARAERHLLLPALHAVAERVGWISRGALNYVCGGSPSRRPRRTASQASMRCSRSSRARHGAARLRRHRLQARGADALIAALESKHGHMGPSGDEASPLSSRAKRTERSSGSEVEGRTWLRSPCLGLCERAPAALFTIAGSKPHEEPVEHLTLERAEAALSGARDIGFAPNLLPQNGSPALRLLRRIGTVDPANIDAYRGAGGFTALQRAFELGPAGVMREVTAAKLVGRGGAAFPTGRKWEAVAREPAQPHYVICNADESEPGTFKDRILMESDPFAVIEAMTIAGFATAGEKGYIYIRGEYPLAFERLEHAISGAADTGLLGSDVLGRGVAFDIEIRRGAGAYICGEETALFNSIEGFRGEPRNKPPFPVQRGLFGKPTVINNVETLVNVLDILTEGRRVCRDRHADSTGTKLFCVSRLHRTAGTLRSHRSARPCASCSTWPAGSRNGVRYKRFCSAARPARS